MKIQLFRVSQALKELYNNNETIVHNSVLTLVENTLKESEIEYSQDDNGDDYTLIKIV